MMGLGDMVTAVSACLLIWRLGRQMLTEAPLSPSGWLALVGCLLGSVALVGVMTL